MTGVFVEWLPGRKNTPGWVEDGAGCHIWVGCRNDRGYGSVRVNGRTISAHRARYEREVGPIPEGMELDHFACDNGPGCCCNPRHCRPVTRRENILRSEAQSAINAAKTHCKNGHPLTGSNLAPTVLKQRGIRRCVECRNARARERYARVGRTCPRTKIKERDQKSEAA